MEQYRHLFEPIRIGSTVLKNRIALAPINNASQMDPATGQATETTMEYFVERARGGAALLVTGVFKVEDEIDQTVNVKQDVKKWSLFGPQSVRTLGEMVARCHAFDAKVFFQLSAGPGRVAPAEVIRSGVQPVSASANECFFAPEVTARELSTREVERIVEAFGRAAAFARSINADGIEVHGHEGYLIDQFTTALWNRRTDKYGGSFERRLTFPLEILRAIRENAGPDFTVTYRMSVRHLIEAPRKGALRTGTPELGRDIEESVELARRLEAAGYDGFSVDIGSYESSYWAHPPHYFPHGFGLELTSAVKDAVRVPVIVAGRLGVPALAERAVATGQTDVVGLARDLLADPEWPRKVALGQVDRIRPCIGCHDGCIERTRTEGQLLSCSVNPSVSRERLTGRTPIPRRKKIVVAGGGAAGMEFARVATQRGHAVTLFEASDRLGGHMLEYGVPDFKDDIKRLLAWYRGELDRGKVDVRYGTVVDAALVEREAPDTVIVATGSRYHLPESAPRASGAVVPCTDVLRAGEPLSGRVIVIGGGSHGAETALWLAQHGAQVSVVEKEHDLLLTGTNRGNRRMLLDMLDELGVAKLTGRRFSKFSAGGAEVATTDMRLETLAFDTAVMAIGVASDQQLYGSIEGSVAEIYQIGDSKRPRKIHEAIYEGWYLGLHV